jgi:hypothetical protein
MLILGGPLARGRLTPLRFRSRALALAWRPESTESGARSERKAWI